MPEGWAIILGARVGADGQPSPALRRRVAQGVALYRAGIVSHLLCSGGGPPDRPSEAALMRALAREGGVPEAAILVEDRARTTLENALFCRALLGAPPPAPLLLVSDASHLPRALYTFRRLGLAVTPSAAPWPRSWRSAGLACLREAVALPVYWWKLRSLR
ncbi:hypothetical protein GALL_288620 [mine drainage metagenome]|uniref:DUF218 domain-containing protein n=1 Tax=mine drainage metagenome TaxID=410659 RepID=A0A1J5RM95_9ZZZZ